MFNLGCADAVRECTERAVGGCVRVTADHDHAGQGGAVFWADDVNNALALGQKRKVSGSAVFAHVVVQVGDLRLTDWVGDAVVAELPAGGRCVVVGRGNDRADAPDRTLGDAQSFESLRAGDFVHQVTVDVKHRGAVFFGMDDVLVPNFVVEGASHAGSWRKGKHRF